MTHGNERKISQKLSARKWVGTGIGRAVAIAFAQPGAKVAIDHRPVWEGLHPWFVK